MPPPRTVPDRMVFEQGTEQGNGHGLEDNPKGKAIKDLRRLVLHPHIRFVDTHHRPHQRGERKTMMKPQIRTLAEQISRELWRLTNSRQDIVSDAMDCLERLTEFLPSGSGFDSGTTIDVGLSTPEKLVFQTSFHAMDEYGSYDGWTDHMVTAQPSFVLGVVIDEPDNDNPIDIMEYVAETFDESLRQKVEAYRDHTTHGPVVAYRTPAHSF